MQLVRDNTLLYKLLLSDGLPGCGKTMLAPILSAMDRVELLNYNTTLENICELNYLDKINIEAAKVLIQIDMDEKIYESMMSRRVNFRPSDLSSALRDANKYKYLKRLFIKGDEEIPEIIRTEKPILHYSTHMKLAFAEPIFYALGDKVVIIEVVRHPLYMIIQQTLNMKKSRGTSRNFHVYFCYNNTQMPWHINGWEDFYSTLNHIEQSIYEINNMTQLTEKVKVDLRKRYDAKIITIPFERFVLNPWPFMEKIEVMLETKINSSTKKMMKKQKVPRQKISDGLSLEIYKRCGWEPPKANLTEKQELEMRRQYAIENDASKKAIDVLDQLSEDYEKKYWSLSNNEK